MLKIGDLIKIIYMEGEPQYAGRYGYVTSIDDAGQIHGTWGGCAIVVDLDKYELMDDLDINTVRNIK